MNSAAIEPVTVKASRWWILVVLVFAVQVALIYFLSRTQPTSSPLTATESPVSIQLISRPLPESALARTFLVSDPTLFAMANPNGFSGDAWLKVPQRFYDFSEQIETPYWLALNATQLGRNVRQFVRTNALIPPTLAQNATPKIFASDVEVTPDLQTDSVLSVEGALARREMLDRPKLKNWAFSEILGNTVTEIAVDQSGLVVAARLLARSGLPEADREALAVSREIRFAPVAGTELMWGNLVFDWHAIPEAETNATNAVLSPK